ncbi:MAG TPA: tetratricopeptide repeat protein [Pirellulales bacterium]|nr:tetratricopeptide repeat protein [Pirellulales bacterium]
METPTYHTAKERAERPAGPKKRRWAWAVPALVVLAVGLAAWAWWTFERSKSHAAQEAQKERDQAWQAKASAEKRLEEALVARRTAAGQRDHARATENAAESDAHVAQAVLEFLHKGVLTSGDHGGWKTVAGDDDVTLRQVVDSAEPKVAETFANDPLAEALIRQILGTTFLDLGDTQRAIWQYERALALLEAELGPEHPDTGDCRNQLAVAYRRADRQEEASRLFEQTPLSSTHAAALAIQASALLADGKPAEAELKLRESLRIRQRVQPDEWTTFDAQSMLGEAMFEQKKYAAAEQALLAGYEGIQQRQAKLPVQDRRQLDRARQRLVRLYEAWGKDDEAAKWRKDSTSAEARKD